MKVWTWLGILALVTTTAACGDDGRTTTRDGSIVLMDGGGTGDASRPDASTGDASRPDGGGTCPPQTLPAPTAPACQAATLSCLMGCMDQPCVEGCFNADPAPMECIGCTNDAIIACATQNGCDDEAGLIVCCAADNCASPDDVACIQSMCDAEIGTFNDCVNGAAGAPPCGAFGTVSVCFP